MASPNDVILALQTAARQLSAYPAGHPARVSAVATAHSRLEELLGPTGALVLGIARDSEIGRAHV